MNGIKIDRLSIEPRMNKPQASAERSPKGTVWDFLNRDIALFATVGDKDKEAFYRQLATLLDAGMDLKSALDLLIGQQKGKFKPILSQLKTELVEGSALSAS